MPKLNIRKVEHFYRYQTNKALDSITIEKWSYIVMIKIHSDRKIENTYIHLTKHQNIDNKN